MAWVVPFGWDWRARMRGVSEGLREAQWPGVLREGAFLVARGRLAREEATGVKGFLDEIIPLGGRGTHLSALAVAIEQRREDLPPPSSLIA